MNAAILAVGSELLTPDRLDTNSLYLTDHLNTLGVEVAFKMVVGDDRDRLSEAIRYALEAVEIVILSGGLGPTEDDLTRDALAAVLGRQLIFSQEIVDWLKERFVRIGRPMAENNKRQAYLVEGAQKLNNERGTAPGQWVEDNGKVIVLLPGPPRELKGMWEAECLPRLKAMLPTQVIRTRFLRVAGMGESDLDQLIAPVYMKYTNPVTTVLSQPGDIQVHLRARCTTAEQAEALLAEVGDPIEALLGDRIYSRNGDSLEAAVGQKLRERGLKVAVAESCTGGMLGERITAVAGSSDYFLGGFLTYTLAAKRDMLGVAGELVASGKAVTEPMARAMAEGVVSKTGADFGIAITGVAGPGQGGEDEPVGIVYIAIAKSGGTITRRVQLWGERQRIRSMAVTTALDMLRRLL